AALARIGRRLEEEDVASDCREREPGRDPRIGRALAHLAFEPARAQPAAHSALVDPQRLRAGLALRDLTRRLAEHVREPALEVAHAGLTRVLADDQPQRAVRDSDLSPVEAVRLELLRHEIALRDPELLVLGVARELD